MLISIRNMKLSAKLLWVVVVVILLSYGLGIRNAFLEDSRNIVFLIVLILALKASFFSKKKN